MSLAPLAITALIATRLDEIADERAYFPDSVQITTTQPDPHLVVLRVEVVSDIDFPHEINAAEPRFLDIDKLMTLKPEARTEALVLTARHIAAELGWSE